MEKDKRDREIIINRITIVILFIALVLAIFGNNLLNNKDRTTVTKHYDANGTLTRTDTIHVKYE